MLKVGVLALQGAVAEHIDLIQQAGATAIQIKRKEQLADIDGLIIPGGESTTIGRLLRRFDFIEAIKQFSDQKKPILGTCAGMIVLAKSVEGQEPHLGLMNIHVVRNAYGRQQDSFETNLYLKGLERQLQAVFIRAPLIQSIGANVEIIAEHEGRIVAARQEHLLAVSFHPELTEDIGLHQYFLNMIKQYSKESHHTKASSITI